ncbi:polymorphic toxin-type HINT domain-containing protein [Pendulispora albinea]|uniref:Hint domain-containing protein n=1 Tax=Pendulispora albinea TaxID=2741071 RepID=A0ABZ2M6G8_9BACT
MKNSGFGSWIACARLLRDGRGASSVEYVLLLVGILLAVAGGFRALGGANAIAANHTTAVLFGGQAPIGGSLEWGSSGAACNALGCITPGGNCFVAGTQVATPSGERAIESLRAGDLVLARGELDDAVTARPILRTFVRPAPSLVDVHVVTDDGARETIRSTPEHLYFAHIYGWLPASDLRPGEMLLDRAGRDVRVTKVAAVAQEAVVYNVEVDVDHTYFVGHSAVWVHNPPGCGGEPATAPGQGGQAPAPGQGGQTPPPDPGEQPPPQRDRQFVDDFPDDYRQHDDFSRLDDTVGQMLVEGVHNKVGAPGTIASNRTTTTITLLADGSLLLTTSGKQSGTSPAQRQALREALRRAGYREDVIANKVLIADERGNLAYLGARDPGRIYKAGPDGVASEFGRPTDSGHHGEGKGIWGALQHGSMPTKQWSSSGAGHNGAACRDCQRLQEQYGIENPTGKQSTGGIAPELKRPSAP